MPLNTSTMYTVVRCYKCGHKLYIQECLKGFAPKLGRVCSLPCPNCGEEPDENWIYVGREDEFPEEAEEDDDDF